MSNYPNPQQQNTAQAPSRSRRRGMLYALLAVLALVLVVVMLHLTGLIAT